MGLSLSHHLAYQQENAISLLGKQQVNRVAKAGGTDLDDDSLKLNSYSVSRYCGTSSPTGWKREQFLEAGGDGCTGKLVSFVQVL
jgi:hypothetical protein